ncbi:unnamed protein product [Durusdinium trenchii]|uniref:Uncharacterized protein n=1 Tax=Durusdinium trenchii TaxID=1381693 RepID=A0ABP0KV19_9DINO
MICFIKKYISDSTLAQPPLLVMTHGRSSTFNLVPDLKRGNNHTAALRTRWKELSRAVALYYGEKYQKSVQYLDQLAENQFWADAELKPLPWHSQPPTDRQAEPPMVMHPAVLNSLAMPLRAVFGGNRHI